MSAMYDRDLLWSTLSGFTHTILRPYDVSAVLEDLAEAATKVLRLVGSGASLVKGDPLTYATSIPSRLAALEQAQEQAQAGPCVQAYRTGAIVAVPDLSLRAQVLADMATGYLINASELSKQQQLNDQLQQALDSRLIIEQAKGMVAGDPRHRDRDGLRTDPRPRAQPQRLPARGGRGGRAPRAEDPGRPRTTESARLRQLGLKQAILPRSGVAARSRRALDAWGEDRRAGWR